VQRHDELLGVAAPPASVCVPCHEGERLRGRFARAFDERGVRAGLRFDHDRHLRLDAVAGQCVGCHGGVVQDGRPPYPDMDGCASACHQAEMDRGACTYCHDARGLRRLVPRTMLRHDAAFARSHGLAATRSDAVCKQCHAERDCLDCHESSQTLPLAVRAADAAEREMLHPRDFLVRHPLEARAAPASCLRCHTVSSCEGCHLERGISGGHASAVSPHPGGWIAPAPSLHGRAARRDILGCASCHDQGPATNCIRCHRVGGHGGNPHPRGWRSARNPASGMCRFCHER
jgi:hypothetical protein